MSIRPSIRILSFGLALLLFCTAFAEAPSEPDPNARFRGIPTLELKDGLYRLNRRLTTLLLIGVDKPASDAAETPFRSGGQADFLALVIFDDANKTISMLQINRDAMVPLTVLNVLGEEIGSRTGQICLSYAFGDGGDVSVELTSDAVSRLLNNTPIDYCVSLNMDGIPLLNDALGGVEVTLKEDLSALDPAMTAGKSLVLNGEQAESYLRARMSVGDGSNLARQERHRTYMRAAAKLLKKRLRADSGFAQTLTEELNGYYVSTLSRGALYNMAEKTSRYEFVPIYETPCETSVGANGFMEAHIDEAAMNRLLADLLYEKVG